jgi:predicted nucleotidyltransferase
LFGSAAEGRALLASDIDVLVVTGLRPSMVMVRLWLSGFKEPFEIHVAGREEAELYKKRARLLRLG